MSEPSRTIRIKISANGRGLTPTSAELVLQTQPDADALSLYHELTAAVYRTIDRKKTDPTYEELIRFVQHLNREELSTEELRAATLPKPTTEPTSP